MLKWPPDTSTEKENRAQANTMQWGLKILQQQITPLETL